jgi:hypothetical protein
MLRIKQHAGQPAISWYGWRVRSRRPTASSSTFSTLQDDTAGFYRPRAGRRHFCHPGTRAGIDRARRRHPRRVQRRHRKSEFFEAEMEQVIAPVRRRSRGPRPSTTRAPPRARKHEGWLTQITGTITSKSQRSALRGRRQAAPFAPSSTATTATSADLAVGDIVTVKGLISDGGDGRRSPRCATTRCTPPSPTTVTTSNSAPSGGRHLEQRP